MKSCCLCFCSLSTLSDIFPPSLSVTTGCGSTRNSTPDLTALLLDTPRVSDSEPMTRFGHNWNGVVPGQGRCCPLRPPFPHSEDGLPPPSTRLGEPSERHLRSCTPTLLALGRVACTGWPGHQLKDLAGLYAPTRYLSSSLSGGFICVDWTILGYPYHAHTSCSPCVVAARLFECSCAIAK
jgi:hypothetical protein